tara:strand:+ start:1127 stop:1579 length:453 start_codon:yes stop_codon:yes gene_type:complete
MNDRQQLTIDFLKKIGININTIEEIDGITITRDGLLDIEKYNYIKELIPRLKKVFSSSFLTSLQKTATEQQRWPLINLLRQILSQTGYTMTPIRKSDGRDLDGKKKYKRYFIIKRKIIIKNQVNNIDMSEITEAVEDAENEKIAYDNTTE